MKFGEILDIMYVSIKFTGVFTVVIRLLRKIQNLTIVCQNLIIMLINKPKIKIKLF